MFYEDAVSDGMVDRDDLAAIRRAEPLLPEKHSIVESTLAALEFRCERVGHRVVNIQDDFSSEQSWDNGSEHQEIRHVVNMDNVVPSPKEKSSGLHKAPEKERHIFNEISEAPTASILGLIQTDHTHIANHLRRRGTLPSQCQEIYAKSSVDSRFGFSDDPRIRLIIGVSHHEDHFLTTRLRGHENTLDS